VSAVLSIRIRKDLKERMSRYDVDWRKEIEEFIEERLRELEAQKEKEELLEILKGMKEKKEGFGSSVVRVERDSL